MENYLQDDIERAKGGQYMKLTNQEITIYAQDLSTFSIDIKLPVRINFFLQKNIQTIITAFQEIETAKLGIGKEYGQLEDNGASYRIPPENMEIVQSELNDLFSLEQELPIHIFKLDDFDGIELTYQQMSAIMFMVEE